MYKIILLRHLVLHKKVIVAGIKMFDLRQISASKKQGGHYTVVGKFVVTNQRAGGMSKVLNMCGVGVSQVWVIIPESSLLSRFGLES